MKRTALSLLIALMCLALCACGSENTTQQPTAAAITPGITGDGLALASWTLTPETWSSPNGATVHLNAQLTVAQGGSAEFVVRLGDADVENAPCTLDGTTVTASAELNAADGYSYFLVLTAADGTLTELPLTDVDSSLTNLASALSAYCNLVLTGSQVDGDKLALTAGTVEIQTPQITDDGNAITCAFAQLVLTLDGRELVRQDLTVAATEVPGGYEGDLAGVTLDVPELEDDGQLILRLEVLLSNGQSMAAEGGAWTYMDGQIISTVG